MTQIYFYFLCDTFFSPFFRKLDFGQLFIFYNIFYVIFFAVWTWICRRTLGKLRKSPGWTGSGIKVTSGRDLMVTALTSSFEFLNVKIEVNRHKTMLVSRRCLDRIFSIVSIRKYSCSWHKLTDDLGISINYSW